MRKKVHMLANLVDNARSWLTGPEAQGIEDDDADAGQINDADVEKMAGGLKRLVSDRSLWDEETDCWLPHDPDAAILQSSLDEYYRQTNSVELNANSIFGESLSHDPLKPARLPSPRSMKNARMALAYQARGIKKRYGPHHFVAHTGGARPFDEKARMVLFGDWASGFPNAKAVAREVWKSHVKPVCNTKQKQLHVIHLGDAYYAGLSRDYRKRFTPFWPVPHPAPANVLSWTIPGNHDMYSGGHGFFKMLKSDKRFANQKGCSHFLLENDHWQVFGLDTAYEPSHWKGNDGIIHKDQAAWLKKHRKGALKKKCVLLTHHQPFCAYSRVDQRWLAPLRPLLENNLVTAWFWGHDHHCAVYKPHLNVSYPVLLGHGGFPQRLKKPKNRVPAMSFTWTAKTRRMIRKYLTFGFAALDFDCDQIHVRLIDPNGTPHHTFTIK
jgi:hypothetical protein